MCTNWLRALLRRLLKDERMLKEYDQVIQEQIEQGIVEKVFSIEGPWPSALFTSPACGAS